MDNRVRCLAASIVALVLLPIAGKSMAAEPPIISPFGQAPSVRKDAVPGYIELSDGSVHPGRIYLTRDKRLILHDQTARRQRAIPLQSVGQIDGRVKKEWMEREWRFKEAASAEKVNTGRSYPVREYMYTITLHDGRSLTGGLSAVVYLQPYDYTPSEQGKYHTQPKTERYILHKRNKGEFDEKLDSLVYVKLIKLGEAALVEGREMVARQRTK